MMHTRLRKSVVYASLAVPCFATIFFILYVEEELRYSKPFNVSCSAAVGAAPDAVCIAGEVLPLAEISARNERSLARLRAGCRQVFGVDVDRAPLWGEDYIAAHRHHFNHLIVADDYRFLACVPQKVSHTVWQSIAYMLRNGFDSSRVAMHKPRYYNPTYGVLSDPRYSPRDILHRLRTYYKAMLSREPLERLLSAYNDKFNMSGQIYSGNTYNETAAIFGFPTGADKNVSRHDLYRNILWGKYKFDVFAEYVSREWSAGHALNMHWNPVANMCSPCHIGYHFLGRYEHAWEDSNYILHQIRARTAEGRARPVRVTYPRKEKVRTLGGYQHRYTRNTSDALRDVIARLPWQTFDKLNQVYRADRLLFGYPIHTHPHMGKQQHDLTSA